MGFRFMFTWFTAIIFITFLSEVIIMKKITKGISIARDILLIVTCCSTTASLVLMIVGHALSRHASHGCVKIKGEDELPF